MRRLNYISCSAIAMSLWLMLGFLHTSAQNVQHTNPSDTVKLSLQSFIQRGLNNASLLDVERRNVELAELRIDEARSQRILPKVSLNTQHGLIPGVDSDSTLPSGKALPRDQYYLDPNLENNWNNWAIFTRAQIDAIQPIYTWGAINQAIEAAKAGADAAQSALKAKEKSYEERLYQLYMSQVLASEIQVLLDEAQDQIDQIERQIDKMDQEGDPNLDQSDVYKFQIYKAQFQARVTEVESQTAFVRQAWNYVLQAPSDTLFVTESSYLEVPSVELQAIDHYRQTAMEQRAELERIANGIKAAEHGIQATQAQSYPALFLGLTASYANTPNRPRQSNPFIINNTNYASAGFGLSIRQNLNFWSIKNDIKKQKIQYRKLEDAQSAAEDGINLEIMETYRKAMVTKAKVESTEEALVTSKKWLRQEQLDYDFGLGEVKDLLDALRAKLELQVQQKQQIYDFHVVMGSLYRASGIPVTQLIAD
ncbi:MAG: TolC family protein [Bacteroidota bacterium]